MSTVSSAASSASFGDINDLIAAGSKTATTATTETGTDRLANKEVFLQLLVAQLKNQNPLEPADGIEYVSQLAQFTQLEQSMSMKQELQTIRETIEKAVGKTETTEP